MTPELTFDEIKNTTIGHLLLLNDCLQSNYILNNDSSLMELLFNAKYQNLTYILTTQYPMELSSELRMNKIHLKKIYRDYAGFFPDFDTFYQVFRQLTDDYGCMIIKNRPNVLNTFIDKIAYYKPANIPIILQKMINMQFIDHNYFRLNFY